MTVKSTIGLYAEQVAGKYLADKGYEILDRNWRRPWGELDIVVKRGDIVAFMEVKANSMASSAFNPENRVDWKKMQKTIRTARTWLAYRKYPDDQEWQIDIIAVTFDVLNRKAKIVHYKNV
jgi:putative endonuclease